MMCEKDTLDLDTSSKGERLYALDSIRFFAAFSVLFGHSWAELLKFSDRPSIASYGGIITLYGMPLFFVLSGFVVHYNYSNVFKTENAAFAISTFLGARVARVYPLFIAAMFVGYSIQGIFLWLGQYNMPFALLALHDLTMTQSWFYQIMFLRPMLYFGFGLGWSVSTEFFFYLAFVAFVIPLSKKKNVRTLMLTAAVYTIGVPVVLLAIQHPIARIGEYYFQSSDDGPNSFSWWFFYFSPYVRIFEFLLGCLVAQIYLAVKDRSSSAREAKVGSWVCLVSLTILVLAGASYAIPPVSVPMQEINKLKENFGLAAPIACIIFCAVRYPRSAIASVLAFRPFVLLGERSYSIYAVHVLMIILFARSTPHY